MQQSNTGGDVNMVNRMGMWLLMITIILLFGSLSLGFMLTETKKQALDIPNIFYFNSLLLVASSILLHRGYTQRIKKGKPALLLPSVVLGIAFLMSQIYAWYLLFSQGFTIDSSGQKVAYLYMLTGVHALHLVGGLLFLVYVLTKYKGKGRKYFEVATFFWHFLGVLWIYLLAVLTLNA